MEPHIVITDRYSSSKHFAVQNKQSFRLKADKIY